MAAKKEEAPKFSKGELIAAAEVFNTSPEIVAGALHKEEGPFTREEAAKKVKAFLNKGVSN